MDRQKGQESLIEAVQWILVCAGSAEKAVVKVIAELPLLRRLYKTEPDERLARELVRLAIAANNSGHRPEPIAVPAGPQGRGNGSHQPEPATRDVSPSSLAPAPAVSSPVAQSERDLGGHERSATHMTSAAQVPVVRSGVMSSAWARLISPEYRGVLAYQESDGRMKGDYTYMQLLAHAEGRIRTGHGNYVHAVTDLRLAEAARRKEPDPTKPVGQILTADEAERIAESARTDVGREMPQLVKRLGARTSPRKESR